MNAMKTISSLKGWIKALLTILFTLFLLFTAGKPSPATSEKLFYRESDNSLYEKYLANREKSPAVAVMYLWAYIKRDPPDYVNNTNGYRDWATKEVQGLLNYINQPKSKLAVVDAHLKSCGCYPCDKCQLKASDGVGVVQKGLSQNPLGGTITPPPDTAIVCVDVDYGGQCKVLSVGTYNNASEIGLPNDIISSVMVGSRVKITLYVHGGLTGESILFTANDPNLTDNWINNVHQWNDNATSLIVEWR
jgi:hypothetical protein